MRPSNLLHLYLVRLRARLAHEVLALVGIVTGVALLFAVSVANTSLTASVERLTDGIVGNAQYEIAARSPDGFDASILPRVDHVAGVKAAAPMLDLQANAVGPNGERSVLLVGGAPRFATLGGAFVRTFGSPALAQARAVGMPSQLAHDLGLTFGGRVSLDIAGARRRAPLGAVLDDFEIGALSHSPVVIAPLAYVQDLAGMRGRLTRIYVEAEPGHELAVGAALRAIAEGRLNVRDATADVHTFDELARAQHSSTALFAVFSAGVGFLFAFSAMLLTVPQRRRLMGDLRADGYGPAVELQVLALDGVMLGLAASALGIVVGEGLSRLVFNPAPSYLAYTFPIDGQREVTAETVVVSVAAGVLTATAAALASYGGISKVTRQLRGGPVLRSVGAALLASATVGAAVAILALAPQLAVLGMVCLTAAALLLRPLIVAAAVRLLGIVERRSLSVAPFIAAVHLRSREHRVRAAAIAATATIAVLSCVAIQGARTDLQQGLNAAARDIDSSAAVWVTAAGTNNAFATTAIRANVAGTLAAVPGVAAIRRYRSGFLDWRERRVWVLAPPSAYPLPIPRSQIMAPDWQGASARLRRGGWAVLSRQLAATNDLTVGSRFVLPAPVPTVLRVAAFSSNLGWPAGAVILNGRDFVRAWASERASAFQLVLRPRASAAVVGVEARRMLGDQSALTVETATERQRRHYASTAEALSRLSEIRTIVLIAAVLAIGAALGGLLLQRRPRLARLRLDGISAREVQAALAIEVSVLVGTAAGIGAAAGLVGQVLLDRALTTITGFPVDASVSVGAAAVAAALVTVSAVGLVGISGAVAARVAPAIGDG